MQEPILKNSDRLEKDGRFFVNSVKFCDRFGWKLDHWLDGCSTRPKKSQLGCRISHITFVLFVSQASFVVHLLIVISFPLIEWNSLTPDFRCGLTRRCGFHPHYGFQQSICWRDTFSFKSSLCKFVALKLQLQNIFDCSLAWNKKMLSLSFPSHTFPPDACSSTK